MKTLRTALLIAFAILVSFVSPASSAEQNILVQTVPKWNIGDSWKFRTEKTLKKTITKNLGLLTVTITFDKTESTGSYTVAGMETVEDIECYALTFTGDQTVIVKYNTLPIMGEAMEGDLIQMASFEGTEYRRISDLAFVKAVIKSSGKIDVAGIAVPNNSTSIVVANPPVQQVRFPLIQGDSWRISSVLTTLTSGLSSDTIITTLNYNSKVLEPRSITLNNGKTYESIAVSQDGLQTVQSESSGIDIEDISGLLFFAPSIGHIVKDEFEGQELVEYVPQEIPQ